MKKIFALALLFTFCKSYSQEYRSVDPFTKVLVGPHIELILEKGASETVLLSNLDISEDEINVKVTGKTLKIYLDEARVTTKYHKIYENGYMRKIPVYKGTKVRATVSYKYLENMSLRGEERHEVKSDIDADKVKVKMYGDGQLHISSISSDYLKAKLYGDNLIKIDGGDIRKQKYKSYGENVIDSRNLKSLVAKSSNFGESEIRLHAVEKIKFSSLGESSIEYSGVSRIRKGIVLGDNEIQRVDYR